MWGVAGRSSMVHARVAELNNPTVLIGLGHLHFCIYFPWASFILKLIAWTDNPTLSRCCRSDRFESTTRIAQQISGNVHCGSSLNSAGQRKEETCSFLNTTCIFADKKNRIMSTISRHNLSLSRQSHVSQSHASQSHS